MFKSLIPFCLLLFALSCTQTQGIQEKENGDLSRVLGISNKADSVASPNDSIVSSTDTVWLTHEGKFVSGKIDLIVDLADRRKENSIGLILMDFNDDQLRYVIYQGYIPMNRNQTVWFKIEDVHGLPVARDIQESQQSLVELDSQEKADLLKELNFNYHGFDFGHTPGSVAHNKIHRIKSIEDDGSGARGQASDRIYFTATTSQDTMVEKKFAINISDGIWIQRGLTARTWYITVTDILRDNVEVVKLTETHSHER